MSSIAILSSRLQYLGLIESGTGHDYAKIQIAPRSRQKLAVFMAKNMLSRRTSTLIIGDPFSRVAQLLTLILRPKEIVIVEDGADTHRALRDFMVDAPLRRSVHNNGPKLLTRLFQCHLKSLHEGGHVEWHFSAAPLFNDALSNVHTHHFARLRAATTQDQKGGFLVIGSALNADGYITEAAYLEWLSSVLIPGSIFAPHRRENEAILKFARSQGASILTGFDSIEEYVAAVAGTVHVSCLPTTPALTLTSLLSSNSVVEVHPVDSSWWTPAATPELVHLVSRIFEAVQ